MSLAPHWPRSEAPRHVTGDPGPRAHTHVHFTHAQAAPAPAEPMASERLQSRPACLLVASGAAEGEAREGGRAPSGAGGEAGGSPAVERERRQCPGRGGAG